MTVPRIVEFASEGVTLRGRLYEWPTASRQRPIVIMAHGFSATICGMVADRYADVFHAAGFDVLLYDHRNFGISDGEPRCVIDAFGQARGFRSAIDFVEGMACLMGRQPERRRSYRGRRSGPPRGGCRRPGPGLWLPGSAP